MRIQGTINASMTTLWSNPTNEIVYIKTLIFHNNSSLADDFAIHIVSSDGGFIGTASSSNRLLYQVLEAGETYEFSPSYPLEFNTQNDSIQGNGTNDGNINFIFLGR